MVRLSRPSHRLIGPSSNLLLCKVAQPGSPTVSKRTTHTTTQNPGIDRTGKGKGRAQSRVPLPSATLSSVSTASSMSSSSATRSVVGGQSASPPTPIPSHVDANSPRPRSLPNTPVGGTATRSSRQPAVTPVQRGTTPRPRDQRPRDAGFHARQTVAAYGYPFRIFRIIASVQEELAPEDWSNALRERIDDSTHEFISALVASMRKDLRLPPLSE